MAERPHRTLPPLLGSVSADLSALLSASLRNYAQFLRDRKHNPYAAKVINDPVWHTIRVEPWEVAILDSPILQRLRGIKQLGLASYVYPGAGYSRFEHSLGVLHQTQRFIDAINRNARTENPEGIDPIQPSDQVLLRMTALLHDIGHGFLSHVSERAMMRLNVDAGRSSVRLLIKQAKDHFHEKPALAELLAALIVLLPEFVDLLELARVPLWSDHDELADHIAHLIVGRTKYATRPFLSEIISGAVDADKLDYMARDSYMAGLPMPVDVDRLLEKVHVVNISARPEYAKSTGVSESDAIQVFAVQLAGGRTVEELLISRVLLYEKLYHHQKVRALEGMIENAVDLLIEGEPTFRQLTTYLSHSDAEFLGLDWRGMEKNESKSTKRAKEIVRDVADRKTLVRAFVFGTTFIEEPKSTDDREEAKLRRIAWQKLVPLVARVRTSESFDFKKRVVERAQDYLKTAGQEALARGLDTGSIVIDLPDVQGIAARTTFWIKQRDGVELYSDVARVERWTEAYEAQKIVGYVFCPFEHAEAVHLAVRDLIKEECGLKFGARAILLTKIVLNRAEALIDALLKQGKAIDPLVVEGPSRRPVVLPADENAIRRAFGNRIEVLASRFRTYSAAEGPSIDIHRIVRWLLQFNQQEIPLAVTLLEHVQFWDRQAVADAFATGIDQLGPAVTDQAMFVPFGGGDKSSHLLGYLIPDSRHRRPDRKIETAASVNDLEKAGEIIFFDDISASGKQGVTALKQMLGQPLGDDDLDEQVIAKARPDVIETLKKSNITFLFITGRRDGVQLLVNTAKELLQHERVSGVIVVPAETNSFQPAARVFLNSEDARIAEDTFRRKGIQALQDKAPDWSAAKIEERALGYGGFAGLTVFYYNVPTATVTALWKESNQKGSRWISLFHRRPSQSATAKEKLAQAPLFGQPEPEPPK